MGGHPAWVFSLQFIEEDLALQSPVCSSIGTTDVSGKFLHLLPEYGKIAIIKSNKFFHPVNVKNDELSDLRLTE